MNSHPPLPGAAGEPGDQALRARLSELADGEADEAGVRTACQAWRDRADMRQAWHAYHLIGDVLRSDELAHHARGDADFLARLRVKLADEPAVLAPTPFQAPTVPPAAATLHDAPVVRAPQVRRRQAWLVPAAAAAGFVAVAGVLVVTRLSAPGEASGPLQARSAGNGGLSVAAGSSVSGTVATGAAGAAMIRDARLDAYLQAHQAVRGGGVAVLPGVGLRSVDAVIPADGGR